MNVQLSLPTPEQVRSLTDSNQWLDHTRASAIHTCHRFGVLRYMLGKVLTAEPRAMPLECGNAMHQAFAVHKLWQVWQTLPATLTTDDESHLARLVYENGVRIYGEDRWSQLSPLLVEEEPSPICLEALHTSGYYDDPYDKRRTLSNMEAALLLYTQRYNTEYLPLVMDDLIAVELPIRLLLTYEDGTEILYIGRADGVVVDPVSHEAILCENKTSSNVQNQWEVQWATSHQITGYLAGLTLMLEQTISNGVVVGLQIPLPAKAEYRGFVWSTVSRSNRAFAEWLRWTKAAWDIWLQFKDRPTEATMLTHSCYRFFRPCQFVPICDLPDGQTLSLDDFTEVPWHPMGETDD